MQILFWISLTVLFYTYVGYGLLLFLLSVFIKRKKINPNDFHPAVTLIVPAYNEELFIEKKIQNSLSLNYPRGKITYLFVTDGSTDKTVEIIQQYKQIVLLHEEKRRGKTAAINKAMEAVHTPVVVFTDANALLHEDSLLKIVRHYADAKVGGVSGEKKILDKEDSAVSLGERIYWQYESLLKKAEAKFYTVIGAAGELYSIRTNLFQTVPEDVILDDFVISARVCQQGYRFVYEQKAYAVETSSATIHDERLRKIRIGAGNFQALFLLKPLLNPFKNFRLTFQYISHKVLRWTLCPILLPVLLVTNAVLVLTQNHIGYNVFFFGQTGFYLLAFLGWLFAGKQHPLKLFLLPYYFVFMNLSLYIGFYRFVTKKQSVFWKKARRKSFF